MISILKEIKSIRKSDSIDIDYSNSDRYRVVVKEEDGTKTAYYFSTPIYNDKTKKIVDFKFSEDGKFACASGSNTQIRIFDSIYLENGEGKCVIKTGKKLTGISENELRLGKDRARCTTNGIAYFANVSGNGSVSFEIETSKSFGEVRANNKSISLMSKKFRPFCTVSAVGTLDKNGSISAPAILSYQKISGNRYAINITADASIGTKVLFEINLYEAKLVQDTTVESKSPKSNNAFGGTAFIGNTTQHGEVWLYWKLDYMHLSDISDRKINRAILHLPKLDDGGEILSAYHVSKRFCSFGSNWNNKISETTHIADTEICDKYQNLNISEFLRETGRGYLLRSDGLIIRSRDKKGGFSAIATGDSSYAPEILEINFS